MIVELKKERRKNRVWSFYILVMDKSLDWGLNKNLTNFNGDHVILGHVRIQVII